MANPVVNAAIRRLVQAGFPEGTARKIATGELSMDPAAKAARMEAYPTPAYSGSTFDIRAFDASIANPESDFGRGAYATTSPLDATANYAGMGPDLTNRVQLESERLADYLVEDEYALQEALDDVGLSLQDYYDDEAGALEAIARSRLVGDAPGGVTYPLRINTQNYAVIGGDKPTVIRQERDYFEEARQSLGEGADEDEVFELADELQANDTEGLYDRIREALADTDAYQEEDAINSILEDISSDILDGEVRVQDIDEAIRRHITEAYDDSTGDLLSSGEISRQTLQNLGFEGVIDNTVDRKFGTNKRGFGGAKVPGMTGVTPDTSHIITFPGFERNIRSQFAAFDPEQAGSSNILAGLGAAGVGAGLMAPEEAEAAGLGALIRRGFPESTARKILSGELPMDTASRMARAREQGFDPDRIVYHGGTVTDQFEPSRVGSHYGYDKQGFFFTNEPSDIPGGAGQYARQTDGQVRPFLLRQQDPYTLDDMAFDFGAPVEDLVYYGGEPQPMIGVFDESREEIIDRAMERGKTGVDFSFQEPDSDYVDRLAVQFRPQDIRSPEAAFDPDQVDSPNLMAGIGAGAVGLGLMAPEEAEASVMSPLERPEDAERRANARAVAVASDTLERLRRERRAVASPLDDTGAYRLGAYLTENRPSEMDPVQRALQNLGLFQGIGEYLRTTGEGQRTTTMQDINAALDIVPL